MKLSQDIKIISIKLVKLLYNQNNIGVYHNEYFDSHYDDLLLWAERELDNIQIYNFTLHSKEFYKNDFSKLDGYIFFDIKESNKTSIKLSINTIERFKRLITITYFINKNNFRLQNGALLPSVIPTNFITCLRNYKNNKFNYPLLEDILRK